MRKNEVKKRLLSLLSAGVVLVTGTACSNSHNRDDNDFDYSPTSYENYDKNHDGELSSSEYKQYLGDCERFRKKYIRKNYTDGEFGPFNYFGIPKEAYQNVFNEKNIEVLGSAVVDFELLNQMYSLGQYSSKGKRNPEECEPFSEEIEDGLITFGMSDGSEILMSVRYLPDKMSLKIEKYKDDICFYIQYLNFIPDEKDELTLLDGDTQYSYTDDMGNALSTSESFKVDQNVLVLPYKTCIYFRYDDVVYYLDGPLYKADELKNLYLLRSTYTPDGVIEYKKDYEIVSTDNIEGIRNALKNMNFEQAAIDFQSLIDGQNILKLNR